MSSAEEDNTEAPPSKSKKGLIITVAAMLLLGGAGFFSTYTGLVQGMIGGHESTSADADGHQANDNVVFVPIEAITITYPAPNERQFRISTQIEVHHDDEKNVLKLMPRVLDVLNGFLRALDPATLSDRAAWYDLRLKMLYRVRMVLGEDRVRDLLITEFILH